MNLLVFGNGLDISLGLKSSYKNFYNYVKTNHYNTVSFFNSVFKEKMEFWSDFESNLTNINENEIELMKVFGITPSKLLNEYKKLFEEWFATIVTDENIFIRNSTFPFEYSTDDFVITFNYSRYILDNFFENIIYIHGEITEEKYVLDKYYSLDYVKNEFVLGGIYTPNKNEWIKGLCKDTSYILKKHQKNISEFCEKIDKIIVFGFSCSEIDYPYIEFIAKKCINKPIDIYCFDNKTFENAKKYKEKILNINLVRF